MLVLTLSPQPRVAEISTQCHFRLLQLAQIFTNMDYWNTLPESLICYAEIEEVYFSDESDSNFFPQLQAL